MAPTTKSCMYCKTESLSSAREHVFPKGLGGPNVFMDRVCEDCNIKFSDYERALIRDSPVAFMRSIEGVEGYHRSNRPAGALLAPILLSFDEDKKVVYEVGQRYPFENFVRPQIILIDGVFYIEGDTAEGLLNLNKKFHIWKKNIACMVVKTFTESASSLQWIEFVDKGNKFEPVVKHPIKKIKAAIKVDVLLDSYPLYPFLSPRLYVNDLDELWVRAQSVEQAVTFLSKLMHFTRQSVNLRSYNKDTFGHPLIYVGQSFNNLHFSQGLFKVGVNCLLHYFPACRGNSAFDNCIEFIMTGGGNICIDTEPKNSIKDSNEGTHNLFFQQQTFGVNVRISFFNGSGGAFNFNVIGLSILKPGDYCRLVVDYQNHTMEFQDKMRMIESFSSKT